MAMTSFEVQQAAQPLASAPAQAQMSEMVHQIFGAHEALLVKQTARGCLQECIGCTARSEYKISGIDMQAIGGRARLQAGAMDKPNVLYALEQSSCCIRTFWSGGRPFDLNISTGGEEGGTPVVTFSKDCGCPAVLQSGDGGIPCCCFLPNVRGTLPNGQVINESKYLCDMCIFVPKFSYLEGNQEIYRVRPQTCCADCCIKPRCLNGGVGVQFNFYNPVSMSQVVNSNGTVPVIQKVWAGWKKECCTTADTFVVCFPERSTPERKAGILGMTFLVDAVIFEGQGGE